MTQVMLLLSSVSPTGAGTGIAQTVRRLSQCVTKTGMSVGVLGLKDKFTTPDCVEWRPLEPQTFAIRGPRAFGYSPELARVLQSMAPEIVHSHGLWMYPSMACWAWARRTGRPYLVTPHGMLDNWALCQSRWKKRIAGSWFQNDHLRNAACLHALATGEVDAIRAYGLRQPVCLIPIGIDLPTGNEPRHSPPWTQEQTGGRKVLLYLGRLHPKKGLPSLLEAWKQLEREKVLGRDDWMLAIAGWDQGGHQAELKAQVAALEITADVLFIGPQFGAAKTAAFQNADAFVLPSMSEGMPMVVLEAWSFGCPVVMTRECNLTEGFAAGAALEVRPETADLARGLTELFAMSATERTRMGERARVLVQQRYAWSNIAREMVTVYKWVVGQGERPECVIV